MADPQSLPRPSDSVPKGKCPTGKRVYYKERLAERAVAEAARRGELGPMRYYQCPECEWWHLSTIRFSKGDRVLHATTGEAGTFIEYLPAGQVRVLWDGRGDYSQPCPGIGYLRHLREAEAFSAAS